MYKLIQRAFGGIIIKGIKKLGRFVKPYRLHCIFGPIFKFIETVLELLMPLILADVIDKGILTGDRQYIFKMAWVLVGTVVVGFFTATVCQYLASVASQGLGTELRNGLFTHISGLSHKELERFGTSSLINRVTTDANNVQYALAMSIRLIVRAPFLCIGGFVMAMIINAKLSLIILLSMPFFIFAIVLVMRVTVKLHGVVQKRLDGLLTVVHENLSGVRVIRAFARRSGEEKRFIFSTEEHTSVSNVVGKISSLLNPVTLFIMNVAIIAILWFGGLLTDRGEMTAGKMIALINYIGQILVALVVVANLVISFAKAYASVGRVNEIFDTKSSIESGKLSFDNDGDFENIVEFKSVGFSYGGGEEELSDINFAIPRGSTVGIIGGTGAGKSTLINLIMRFYEVSRGEIFVGGKNVKEYDLDSLRENIALVPQRVELFSGTIEENIKWGKKSATHDEVVRAAEIAQARGFIEDIGEGYGAQVERGGSNFSGGQRQRLAIARAVIREAPILILDDSSSALDYATDKALRKAIETRLDSSTTLIMVSQRVNTTLNSDIILVLDDGRLAGAGTHSELIESCGEYIEICASQGIFADSKAAGEVLGDEK